jgi:type I site-specific restriction endonuclease
MTKLIVLDEMIGSMTEFKQIIGRGTRLREKEGKTHFVVMDLRLEVKLLLLILVRHQDQNRLIRLELKIRNL